MLASLSSLVAREVELLRFLWFCFLLLQLLGQLNLEDSSLNRRSNVYHSVAHPILSPHIRYRCMDSISINADMMYRILHFSEITSVAKRAVQNIGVHRLHTTKLDIHRVCRACVLAVHFSSFWNIAFPASTQATCLWCDAVRKNAHSRLKCVITRVDSKLCHVGHTPLESTKTLSFNGKNDLLPDVSGGDSLSIATNPAPTEFQPRISANPHSPNRTVIYIYRVTMWRKSLSLRATLKTKHASAIARSRWMSTALTPEEQEILNEPREGMDYDVLLVRIAICLHRGRCAGCVCVCAYCDGLWGACALSFCCCLW